MRDNESNTMRGAPVNSQPPQASASTNSAIRAELSIADEESQETGAVSSGEAAVDKFPVRPVAKVFQELPAGNQTNFSAAARRRARVEGAGFTHKILERRGRRPSKFSGSKRMSAALFAEVEAQKKLLARCRGCSSADCIYVLVQRDGVGRIKIGTTIDPYQRTGSHQSNAFGELKLLAAFHGDKNDERALHHRFADDLVYGHREHFYPSKRLVRWVEDVVRLNGRDDGLCWSCRDAAIKEQERLNATAWTRNVLPFSIEVTKVDQRCGDKCRAAYRWFHIPTREILGGGLGQWSQSEVCDWSAERGFRSPDSTGWAVHLWIARNSGRRDRSAASDFARLLESAMYHRPWPDDPRPQLTVPATWKECGIPLSNWACRVLPPVRDPLDVHDGDFPVLNELWDLKWAGERSPKFWKAQHHNFVSAMLWLRDSLFPRFGIAALCACDIHRRETQRAIDILTGKPSSPPPPTPPSSSP